MSYTKQFCSLCSFHSFLPRAQFVLCCGGGKLLRVWLWCSPWHSFPERAWRGTQTLLLRTARSDPIAWTWSAHSSALTSQRLLVGNAAFYNISAFKWQLNEQKSSREHTQWPVSWEGPSALLESHKYSTDILSFGPRQKFSLFPCPCKQHTERWGSWGKHITFSILPWKKYKVTM